MEKGKGMTNRVTKKQLAGACVLATNAGRAIGVIKGNQRVTTVTAWNLDYVAIIDVETGGMIAQLTECDTTRVLYGRARAINTAWEYVARAVSPSELRAAV